MGWNNCRNNCFYNTFYDFERYNEPFELVYRAIVDKEGKTIAKTKDGFQICEVEGDESHTFVGLRSFLDNWLLVREDYVIPIYGEITRVYWDLKFIEDEEFFSAVAEILEEREADFIYGYIHPCCSFPLSDLVIEVPPVKK